jgi:hypothetical protein
LFKELQSLVWHARSQISPYLLFVCILISWPSQSSWERVLSSSLCYWGSEVSGNLPRARQLVSGRAGTVNHVFWTCVLPFYT